MLNPGSIYYKNLNQFVLKNIIQPMEYTVRKTVWQIIDYLVECEEIYLDEILESTIKSVYDNGDIQLGRSNWSMVFIPDVVEQPHNQCKASFGFW